MILPCTCSHPYQDTLYGVGQRVHNSMKKENTGRCTVCGKVNQISIPKIRIDAGKK